MGKNLVKQTSFRFPDEKMIMKIDKLAKENNRNRRQEVELIIRKYIKDYEEINGEIPIDDVAIDN